MGRISRSLLVLAGLAAWGSVEVIAQTPPSIDKPKLEAYIRFAEGFPASVQVDLGTPEPTPYPGYYKLTVHLSRGDTKQEKSYYLTSDGRQILGGPIWDLAQNPFAENSRTLQASQPSVGLPNAPVVIVVYSDFECPYCREFARVLREDVPKKYPKEVRVVFQDFPIASLHPWARGAAEAGRCLGDGHVDDFWAYHDWIFAHQGEIDVNNWREKTLTFARQRKLDADKLAACLDQHAKASEVEADLKEGRRLQIAQTPTFFLNGRMVGGAVPWQALDMLIAMELNRPKFIPPLEAGK